MERTEPWAKDDALYLVDNGACYCGKHLGASARWTGRDISGQEVYPLTLEDVKDGAAMGAPPLACEECHRVAYGSEVAADVAFAMAREQGEHVRRYDGHSAPALDPVFVALLKARRGRGEELDLLRAWTDGWHRVHAEMVGLDAQAEAHHA